MHDFAYWQHRLLTSLEPGEPIGAFIYFVLFAAIALILSRGLRAAVHAALSKDLHIDRTAISFMQQIGTVLMGGLGFLLGPLVGAALVRWLFVVAGYGARYELLIYGIVFLGVVIYARDGVMGWLTTAWQKVARAPQPRPSRG